MFFKLPCFEGENEYRFVISRIHDGGICKPEDRVPVYFRLKNGVLIPYVKEKNTRREFIKKGFGRCKKW